MKISEKQRKAWLDRALTLQRKQYLLFCDMLEVLGEDHEATDYADNGNVSMDDLVDVLRTKTYRMWQ